MTSKQKSFFPFTVVVRGAIVAALSCCGSPANAAHDMCPDYSEYKGVLDEGNARIEKGSFERGALLERSRSQSRDLFTGHYPNHYASLKDPKLQQYIDAASGSEFQQELTNSIRWWSAVAAEAKKHTSSEGYQFVLARVESRLADLALLESWSDVLDDSSEPPYLEWREAARARQKSIIEPRERILNGKAYRSLAEYFRSYESLDSLDPSSVSRSDKTLPLFQGCPPRKWVGELFADPFWVKRPNSSTELSIPVLSPALQNRLQKILTEKVSTDLRNSKTGSHRRIAVGRAMNLYESAVAKRKRLPDGGRSAFCVLDLIKLAILKQAGGNEYGRESNLAEATKLFVSAPTAPHLYMADDYNLANLQSSKIVYLTITKELVSYGKRNSKEEDLKVVEKRLETDFPRRWAPTAMRCYADAKDRKNVLRVYDEFGLDVLTPDAEKDRAVFERMKVADALLKVDATQQATTFISAWIENLPDDQIGKAIQSEAIGEVNLKRGLIEQAVESFEKTVTTLSSIGTITEYVAKSQRDICWKMLNKVTSTESPRLKALRDRINDVIKAANHKLMQLECIALSKQLAVTGSRLERLGQYESAGKVYAASADIKVKNLGANDAESIRQQLDTARVLLTSGKLEEADIMLKDAITAMRRSADFDGGDLRSALETRADVLSRLNRDADAERVYAELRAKN